jgi:hypothetical protein
MAEIENDRQGGDLSSQPWRCLTAAYNLMQLSRCRSARIPIFCGTTPYYMIAVLARADPILLRIHALWRSPLKRHGIL